MLYLLSALGVAAGLATATVDSTELRREDLMKALSAGGYTILLRHARTDRIIQETPGSVPPTREQQRNLSADGVRDAALMGLVLRKYHIPVSEILSSPMYRAVETAEFAAGTPKTTMALRVFPATAEQAALVAVAPKAGTNRLLVTHHFVIEGNVPGVRPGEFDESEAAVVRPTGDGRVQLVGRITLADWNALAYPVRAGTASSNAATASTAAPAGGHGAHTGPRYVGPSAANALAAGERIAIPDTPTGRLAKDYVHAYNSGDTTKMRAFIDRSLISDANRPTDVRVQSYIKLFADNGPLEGVTFLAAEGNEMQIAARSKRGVVRLTVRTSAEQVGRLASVQLTFGEGGSP